MTIADRIKQKRIELDLSQSELAIRAGYNDKSAISKFEHAGDDISMKQVRRIASALDVSPAYLMGWEENESIEDIIRELPLTPKEMNEALRFYSYFKGLSSSDQTAIRTLIESLGSDS